MRTGKALIRLRVCTGWYEPSLVAHATYFVGTLIRRLNYLQNKMAFLLLSTSHTISWHDLTLSPPGKIFSRRELELLFFSFFSWNKIQKCQNPFFFYPFFFFFFFFLGGGGGGGGGGWGGKKYITNLSSAELAQILVKVKQFHDIAWVR